MEDEETLASASDSHPAHNIFHYLFKPGGFTFSVCLSFVLVGAPYEIGPLF